MSALNDCTAYRSLLSARRANGVSPASVIINADDLGLSESIDCAIVGAVGVGAITSASLIAVGEDLGPAACWARERDDISIGVHLCLTDGLMPITQAHGLVDPNGRFVQLRELTGRALCRDLPLDGVRTEWQAQIALIRSMGIHPTHLDSHQHAHILPGIRDVIVELAADEHLAVRHTAGPFGFSRGRCRSCPTCFSTLCRPGFWKSAVVRRLGRSLKRKLDRAGVPSPGAYISPSSLCGRMRCEVTEETVLMLAALAAAVGGTIEWVVHPSMSGDHGGGPAWMSRMRSSENSLMDGSAHVRALADSGVRVGTYSMLASS